MKNLFNDPKLKKTEKYLAIAGLIVFLLIVAGVIPREATPIVAIVAGLVLMGYGAYATYVANKK